MFDVVFVCVCLVVKGVLVFDARQAEEVSQRARESVSEWLVRR
jgi:hypothetical protein